MLPCLVCGQSIYNIRQLCFWISKLSPTIYGWNPFELIQWLRFHLRLFSPPKITLFQIKGQDCFTLRFKGSNFVLLWFPLLFSPPKNVNPRVSNFLCCQSIHPKRERRERGGVSDFMVDLMPQTSLPRTLFCSLAMFLYFHSLSLFLSLK